MRLRFIGQYTGGRSSITLGGVTFHGREPCDVPDFLAVKLMRHPEFTTVKGRPRKDMSDGAVLGH